MNEKPIVFIFATGPNGEFGNKGGLPWPKNITDLKKFKKITSTVDYSSDDGEPTPSYVTNAVIMGRKTWDSLPESSRPLRDRFNVVVSSNPVENGNKKEPYCVANTVQAAIEAASSNPQVQTIFVIGGISIFEECIARFPFFCKQMIHTTVYGEFEADLHLYYEKMNNIFSKIESVERYTDETSGLKCCVRVWSNPIYEDISKYIPLNILTASGSTSTGMSWPSFTVESGDKIHSFFPLNTDSVPCSSNQEHHHHNIQAEIRFEFGNPEESQYLRLVEEIIQTGDERVDRTKVGTRAVFGKKMVFSLRDGTIPLLTTKRVPFGCVAKELLWFIGGSTDSKKLSETGVKIWDANGSRAFLDGLGFTERETGDLGPVYGFQWRHFGAKYVDCHADYTGQGVDQLAECIQKIKENPTDRRIIMSAWNPADLRLMALPPCHMFCQFFVSKGELSCMLYQRSADMGLGVPFNIASYALLTHMVAHVCGLKPGEFHHVLGDTHVYLNHFSALKEQISREPRPFPTLEFNRQVTSIDDFKFEDFKIVGYNPHPSIPMEMAL